jgi:hypothetical protein
MAKLPILLTNEVKITPVIDDKLSVYFNRGLISTQRVARALGAKDMKDSLIEKVSNPDDKSKLRESLSGDMIEAIQEFLARADGKGKIYAALYELVQATRRPERRAGTQKHAGGMAGQVLRQEGPAQEPAAQVLDGCGCAVRGPSNGRRARPCFVDRSFRRPVSRPHGCSSARGGHIPRSRHITCFGDMRTAIVMPKMDRSRPRPNAAGPWAGLFSSLRHHTASGTLPRHAQKAAGGFAMPLDPSLFSVDDPLEFRKWCRFQLYDMPANTRSKVIWALRAAIGGPRRVDLLAAMRVDLPGVGLPYQQTLHMQANLGSRPHLLVFRFYTGAPSALLPARVFQHGLDHQAIVGIQRGEARADAREVLGLPRFRARSGRPGLMGRPAPPGRLGSSSYRTTPHMLQMALRLTPEDLQNIVGSDGRDSSFYALLTNSVLTPIQQAEIWSSYMHQTGRRHNSLYLSCTAVMPRMVRSGSGVLRVTVMPRAQYLGLFLVPTANMVVKWVAAQATEQASVQHSVEEIEVLYKLLPLMESCQILRFRNPFAIDNGGAPIPLAGSHGEGPTTLALCPDPGYAADDMPGLEYAGPSLLEMD